MTETEESVHVWRPTTNTLAVWRCSRCGATGFDPHPLPRTGCLDRRTGATHPAPTSTTQGAARVAPDAAAGEGDADVLVTDPPYGVAHRGGGARKGYRNRATSRPIENDHDAAIRDAALTAWGDRPALVFGTWRVARPTHCRQVLVWWKREHKNLARHGGRAWASNWEEIYVMGSWPKTDRQDAAHGVIPTDEHRSAAYGAVATVGHPTPKPLVLMESLIGHAPPGVIADPFAGSGSTLIAARTLGRRSVGVEVDEAYCEIAARRLAQDNLFGGVA